MIAERLWKEYKNTVSLSKVEEVEKVVHRPSLKL